MATIRATCRFDVDGQAWTVRVANGKLEEIGESAAPDASVRTDTSSFLLLATLRQSLAERANQLAIRGAHDSAEQVLTGGRIRV